MPALSQLEGYDYRFEAGSNPNAPVLLLLHGTGGNEHDLIPFARLVAPEADIISPRGNVSENGAARYFRRISEGVFDLEDLKARTEQMLRFLDAAGKRHNFTPARLLAIGFSNGANFIASLMLTAPKSLSHGIMIRAMVPFQPEKAPDLKGCSALLAAGKMDRMIPAQNTEYLATMLRDYGARVELKWQNGGHGLTPQDLNDAREYMKAWPMVAL